MHEVAVSIVNVTESCRFGQAESYHGQDYRPGLREWTTTSTWDCTESRVCSRFGRYSHSFCGWLKHKLCVCVPTWLVLTYGCKVGVEVDGTDVPDEVRARE